jgi:hypothetical protein
MVTALLLFPRWRELPACAFRAASSSAWGGTRCQQRVGDAALPSNICAFGDGIVPPAAGRSASAPRGRIDAKLVQRMLILSIGTDRFECAVL